MKRGLGVLLACVLLVWFPVNALAEEGRSVKFVVDVDPASFFVSPDLDGFYVERTSGGYWKEEIDGTTAWVPSVNAGIGFNVGENMVIDGTVGAGWYVGGDVLESTFITERISGRYKIGPVITLGVQAGLIQFDDLEWEGDFANDQVSFSDSNGYLAGLSFTAGSEMISFKLAVEYVDLDPFDVTTSGGWQASNSDLDLSGTLVTLGMNMRF